MAKKIKNSKNDKYNDDFLAKYDVEIHILSLIAVSVLTYIIIFSNNNGLVGDFLKGVLFGTFGIGLAFIPFAFIYSAIIIFRNHDTKLDFVHMSSIYLLIIFIMVFLHLLLHYEEGATNVFDIGYFDKNIYTGGFIGALVGNTLSSMVGKTLSFILDISFIIIFTIILMPKDLLTRGLNASSSLKNKMKKFSFRNLRDILFKSDYYDDDYDDDDYDDEYEEYEEPKSRKNKGYKNLNHDENPVDAIDKEMEEYQREVRERETRELERLRRIEKKYKKSQKEKKANFGFMPRFSGENTTEQEKQSGMMLFNINRKQKIAQDKQVLDYDNHETDNVETLQNTDNHDAYNNEDMQNIDTQNMTEEERALYEKLKKLEKAYEEVKEDISEFYVNRSLKGFGVTNRNRGVLPQNNNINSKNIKGEITDISLSKNVELIEEAIEETNLNYQNLVMPSEIYSRVMFGESSFSNAEENNNQKFQNDDVLANLYNDIKSDEDIDFETETSKTTEMANDEKIVVDVEEFEVEEFEDDNIEYVEDILEDDISLEEQEEIYEDIDEIDKEFQEQKDAMVQFKTVKDNYQEIKNIEVDDVEEENDGAEYDGADLDEFEYGDYTEEAVDRQSVQQTENIKQTENIQSNIVQQDTASKNLSQQGNDLTLQQNIKQVDRTKPFTFPSFDILNKGQKDFSINHTQAVQSTSIKLEETLESFGVKAKVISVSRGPSVTRYEVQPGVGVKVSKIANLSDDLALNLAAQDIRIQAPIPGKRAVGIEVPNDSVEMVYLREILDTDKFKDFDSNVAFGIGKDIAGNVVVHDIAKMPHLLVAGATGSGKSVCINTLITSILYKSKPSDVKLIMIDPKVVELSIYNGIPHLLIPVVTDPKKANAALQWAVVEMEKRFTNFSESNVRNLAGYNNWLKNNGYETLPSIVIIIDELADLMMTSGKEVEDSICRLAQKARAAGIHLIVATQRPSVDVITGLIKANIPSRLAFAVSSGTDSRTILDTVGAERLLGKGDMLFSPMGSNEPVRIQGAFVSDSEVEDIVEHLKTNGGGTVDNNVLDEINSAVVKKDKDKEDEDKDALFYEAMEYLIQSDRASTSMLQTNFSIGYNRASRLISTFEKAGYIGPQEGSKPRKILITMTQWNDIKDN